MELEPERKCWRSVGGVLVERTIKEVKPALEDRIAQLSQKIAVYSERLAVKQKELAEIESAVGIKASKNNMDSTKEENEDGAKVGVLA